MTYKTLVLSMVAVVLLSGGLAIADSLAERLEKGIYTEETVGDLDAARDIYRQIVADAKADSVVAAQAQFRLAQCFLKQEKKDEAIAAFKKLIEEFADQQGLVAKARKHVPQKPSFELLPEPWVDGESLKLQIKLATGHDIGTFVFSVNSSAEDGKDIWLANVGRYIVTQGVQVFSHVKVDRNTFRPMSSLFRHPNLGQFEATYTSNVVTIKTVNRDDGKQNTRKTELDGIYYDTGQAVLLFRRLPLAKGFKAAIPIFATFAGGPLEFDAEVTAVENVAVPAGTFECYRLQMAKGQETYWISTDEHRYLVKFEAEGLFGALDSIRVNKPSEMVEYRDELLGFSMAAPSDWYFVKKEYQHRDADDPEIYNLFDPKAEANSMLRGRPAEILREHEVDSRGLAELRVKKRTQLRKDFKVRADSWTKRTIAGHSGTSFIADFIERDKKMVQYYVCSLGESTAVEFITNIERDKFDSFRSSFDAIIDTYREKSE